MDADARRRRAGAARHETPMRTLHVDQNNPAAPYRTINAAARDAQPGDTVLVHAGVYRERVCPPRGGEEGRPITCQAAPGEPVCIRGSEVFQPGWKREGGFWVGSLAAVRFGAAAYGGLCDERLHGDFNPFLWQFNRARRARPHALVVEELERRIEDRGKRLAREVAAGADMLSGEGRKRRAGLLAELQARTGKEPAFARTLGQVFVDGEPLIEVETRADVETRPGTWMAAPGGDALWLNVESPADRLVEISLRHTVFSPLTRGLGHIAVRGFTLEHAANHFPTWDREGWPQAGLLSTRGGHRWTVEDNTIRFAKSIGMDCGSEGDGIHIENRGEEEHGRLHDRDNMDTRGAGYHLIRGNRICDNGLCGLAGIRHTGTRVVGNVIERNNCDGWTSPWWEFAGIKFHFFFAGEIRDNLIRDNEAHGIWLDNQWRGSRITGNVIVNNLWSGINVELGRGPVTIDRNVIALTRQGDGIYGHDVADVTIEHNLALRQRRLRRLVRLRHAAGEAGGRLPRHPCPPQHHRPQLRRCRGLAAAVAVRGRQQQRRQPLRRRRRVSRRRRRIEAAALPDHQRRPHGRHAGAPSSRIRDAERRNRHGQAGRGAARRRPARTALAEPRDLGAALPARPRTMARRDRQRPQQPRDDHHPQWPGHQAKARLPDGLRLRRRGHGSGARPLPRPGAGGDVRAAVAPPRPRHGKHLGGRSPSPEAFARADTDRHGRAMMTA
jgi:hypothetical protein